MTADLDKAKAKVEFKMSPNNEEGTYCQSASDASGNQPNKDNVFTATFSNIALNFSFDF